MAQLPSNRELAAPLAFEDTTRPLKVFDPQDTSRVRQRFDELAYLDEGVNPQMALAGDRATLDLDMGRQCWLKLPGGAAENQVLEAGQDLGPHLAGRDLPTIDRS
ncbi:MAG: hypothetical protein AAGA56_17690, partial [Myxococcota bacterium]